jgi:hypothetical protein
MIKRRRQADGFNKASSTSFAAPKIFLATLDFELRVSSHYRRRQNIAIKMISANFTHKQHSFREGKKER